MKMSKKKSSEKKTEKPKTTIQKTADEGAVDTFTQEYYLPRINEMDKRLNALREYVEALKVEVEILGIEDRVREDETNRLTENLRNDVYKGANELADLEEHIHSGLEWFDCRKVYFEQCLSEFEQKRAEIERRKMSENDELHKELISLCGFKDNKELFMTMLEKVQKDLEQVNADHQKAMNALAEKDAALRKQFEIELDRQFKQAIETMRYQAYKNVPPKFRDMINDNRCMDLEIERLEDGVNKLGEVNEENRLLKEDLRNKRRKLEDDLIYYLPPGNLTKRLPSHMDNRSKTMPVMEQINNESDGRISRQQLCKESTQLVKTDKLISPHLEEMRNTVDGKRMAVSELEDYSIILTQDVKNIVYGITEAAHLIHAYISHGTTNLDQLVPMVIECLTRIGQPIESRYDVGEIKDSESNAREVKDRQSNSVIDYLNKFDYIERFCDRLRSPRPVNYFSNSNLWVKIAGRWVPPNIPTSSVEEQPRVGPIGISLVPPHSKNVKTTKRSHSSVGKSSEAVGVTRILQKLNNDHTIPAKTARLINHELSKPTRRWPRFS